MKLPEVIHELVLFPLPLRCFPTDRPATLGTGLWATLLTLAGYGLSANFRQVETYLDPASYVVLAVIVVLYVRRVVKHKGERATT